MKKSITFLAFLSVSFPAFAEIPQPKAWETLTGTTCIGGYLYAYATKTRGLSIVQVMKADKYSSDPIKPIPCKGKP